MRKTNERTLRMMKEFITLHEEGLSIPEIAKRFDLSETTVYKRLDEIAEKIGVTRESFLEKPFKADHSGRNFTPVRPVNTTEFCEHYEMAMVEIGHLQQVISQAIKEFEEIEQLFEEDFEC